ncbi:MAG: hypothetical protein ABI672_17690 [Vicinamibacteria bacterium]
MLEFLKGNARATTIALAVLMLVVAAGGFWSGDGVSKVAGVLGFMLFLWPVLFLIMIPLRLLARVNQKAAAFGSSIGRQAVASPRKSAAQAISDAATAAAPAPPVPRRAEVTHRNAIPNTSSDEGTPAEALRMAEQFVALTERNFGFRLNYSPETLGPVDLLVDKVKATGVSEQDGSGMIFSIGCYVGEVMVRHAGGEWRPTADLNMQAVCSWPLVVRMPDGSGMNPIGKAFKRFRNGEGDSLAYFYQMALKMPEIIERSQAK